MTLLEQIQKGKQPGPRRVLLYGTHGVGKSTWAAQAERPIFIPTEDGLGEIDCDKLPVATKYADVVSALSELYTAEHSYQTLVIDSLDWAERLVFAEVCAKRGVESIEEIAFAKGYVFALNQWREILEGLDALRNDRGMGVILIAHTRIERFDNPETESYDRYVPRLNKHASALIAEWVDHVLFACFRTYTKRSAERFGQEKHRGVGTGERILRTTERPAHVAKNRVGLPDEIPLDYQIFDAHVRGETPPAAVEPEPQPQLKGA